MLTVFGIVSPGFQFRSTRFRSSLVLSYRWAEWFPGILVLPQLPKRPWDQRRWDHWRAPGMQESEMGQMGQMGSALMGSLQISCFLTEGLFGYSPQPTFISPEVPGRTFFRNLSKLFTFCSGPVSVDPICPQPTAARCRGGGIRGISGNNVYMISTTILNHYTSSRICITML